MIDPPLLATLQNLWIHNFWIQNGWLSLFQTQLHNRWQLFCIFIKSYFLCKSKIFLFIFRKGFFILFVRFNKFIFNKTILIWFYLNNLALVYFCLTSKFIFGRLSFKTLLDISLTLSIHELLFSWINNFIIFITILNFTSKIISINFIPICIKNFNFFFLLIFSILNLFLLPSNSL